MSAQTYWLDSNVLIEANSKHYPIKQALLFWERLGELAIKGTIKCPRRVYKEVAEQDKHKDEVAGWLKSRKELGMRITPSPAVNDFVGTVQEYVWRNPRYTQAHKMKFSRGADAWVVAHAKIDGGTVVTWESAKHPDATMPRIPDLCKHFADVECITILKMFLDLGITF